MTDAAGSPPSRHASPPPDSIDCRPLYSPAQQQAGVGPAQSLFTGGEQQPLESALPKQQQQPASDLGPAPLLHQLSSLQQQQTEGDGGQDTSDVPSAAEDAALAGPEGAGQPGGPDPKRQICFDFTKGQCNRGAACKFSHALDQIIQVNSQEKGICFDFLKGLCQRGLLCRFSHDLRNLQAPSFVSLQSKKRFAPICYDFVKSQCTRGDECKYSHDYSSILYGPRAPGKDPYVICVDFTRGKCARGANCRYSHVDPRMLAGAPPLGGLAGAMGQSMHPALVAAGLGGTQQQQQHANPQALQGALAGLTAAGLQPAQAALLLSAGLGGGDSIPAGWGGSAAGGGADPSAYAALLEQLQRAGLAEAPAPPPALAPLPPHGLTINTSGGGSGNYSGLAALLSPSLSGAGEPSPSGSQGGGTPLGRSASDMASLASLLQLHSHFGEMAGQLSGAPTPTSASAAPHSFQPGPQQEAHRQHQPQLQLLPQGYHALLGGHKGSMLGGDPGSGAQSPTIAASYGAAHQQQQQQYAAAFAQQQQQCSAALAHQLKAQLGAAAGAEQQPSSYDQLMGYDQQLHAYGRLRSIWGQHTQ